MALMSRSELNKWAWIKLTIMPNERVLRKGRKMFKIQAPSGQLSVNSVDAMVQSCSQGMGLCTPPVFVIDKPLRRGSLVDVLPDWKVDPISVYAFWPKNTVKNKNAQRLIEKLKNVG